MYSQSLMQKHHILTNSLSLLNRQYYNLIPNMYKSEIYFIGKRKQPWPEIIKWAASTMWLCAQRVWSESSLCAQWVAKGPSFFHADSEDSDQTGRMPRLIRVLAGCTLNLLVLSQGGSDNKTLLSVCYLMFHELITIHDLHDFISSIV